MYWKLNDGGGLDTASGLIKLNKIQLIRRMHRGVVRGSLDKKERDQENRSLAAVISSESD
jgi:hypothetical protein